MNKIKLIENLGNSRYIVEIPENSKVQARDNSIYIAHDYVAFSGREYAANLNGSISDVFYMVNIQIPIRSFAQVMKPVIEGSNYMQPEHLKDHAYSEDDKYYTQYDLDKPRYRAGDLYASYSSCNEIVRYYDTTAKAYMVAVKPRGGKIFSHMTLQFFNEFVRDNLKYK